MHRLAEMRCLPRDLLEEVGIYAASGDRYIIPYYSGDKLWYERIYRPKPVGKQPKYWTPSGTLSRMYNPLGLLPHAGMELWVAEGKFLSLIHISEPTRPY